MRFHTRCSKFLLVLLMGVPACAAPAPWVRVVVDRQLEVQLPSTPQVLGTASAEAPGQLFTVTDDRALYQIIRTSIRDTTILLKGFEARQTFYNGAVGMLLRSQQRSHLVRRTAFSSPAGEGVELEYQAVHQGTGQLVSKYQRFLLVGRVGYAFGFVPHRGVAPLDPQTQERCQRFFASIACK